MSIVGHEADPLTGKSGRDILHVRRCVARMRKELVYTAVLIVVAACAPALHQVAPTSPLPIVSATLPACQPSPIQRSKVDFPEVRGTMKSDGEMWALLFFDQAQAGKEEKIVWRITGSGRQFNVRARNDDGTVIFPTWGPVDHGQGSNWHRPGNEWGTGFNFPEPGCWTLTATRGTTTGEIRLNVLAP